MDRRKLKETARQCVRDAQYSPKRVTLVALLTIVLLILVEWVTDLLTQNTSSSGQYLSQTISAGTRSYMVLYLVSLLCQLALVLLWVGYAAFSLRLSRGKPYGMAILLEGGRRWSRTILLYLWMSLLLALWSSLFSMPVSYLLAAMYVSGGMSAEVMMAGMMVCVAVVMLVISYRYRMAWFVLLDQPELSVRQTLTRAKTINQTHRLQLFRLDLSFLPWMLLSVLTCGILLIWKLPYITATYALAYDEMVADYSRRQAQAAQFLEQQRRGYR